MSQGRRGGMAQQMRYFWADYQRVVEGKRLRLLTAWTSRNVVGVLVYRLERGAYLSLGGPWKALRLLFLPLLQAMYAYSNCEINYHADIGPGLWVLHPSIGVVVSSLAVVGKNLILTGGNVVGGKAGMQAGQLRLGDDCELGANAVILGPCHLGSRVMVGAGAVVTRDAPDDVVLRGVPAQVYDKRSLVGR